MNTSSENKETQKESAKKHKHFWITWTIAIAIVLTIVWFVFYFFSYPLFNTVIKRNFSEIFKQQYTINFEDLKINILTQEIIFYDTRITKSAIADSNHSENIIFYSNILYFQKFDFLAFPKKHILKFNKININNLKLAFEKSDVQNKPDNLSLPISSYLRKFEVLNFKVSNAQINYKKDNDSIFIPSLNFEVFKVRVDSLQDTVVNNRFHYSDINLSSDNQLLHLIKEQHLLSWKKLKLSSKEKSFELTDFSLMPSPDNHKAISYTIQIPKLKLEKFEFDSLISKNIFLANKLSLDANYLNILIKSDSGLLGNKNKTEWGDLFENYLKGIFIDSCLITINKSKIDLPNNQQLNFKGQTKLDVTNFCYTPKIESNFSVTNGILSMNDVAFNNLKNKQKIIFNQGRLNFIDQTFSINEIGFVSDSTANLNLQLKKITFEKIDWDQLLKTNNLFAEKLMLSEGDFTQQKSFKSHFSIAKLTDNDSPLLTLFHSVKIKNIQFIDWNYSLASKAIKAKRINAQLLNVQIPSELNFNFGAFIDFNIQIDELSWISKDRLHYYLANNISSDSQSQNISIQIIQSFPRWKVPKNKPVSEKERFKFYGENIQIKTQKAFYKLSLNDTLILNNLTIDSLNLKQFGNVTNLKKSSQDIPPVKIHAFKLNKGNFAAYNDSSSVSQFAQINGIHFSADSLEIFSDSLAPINYKRLFGVTKNGFYHDKTLGLIFDFQKIDYNSNNQTLSINQLKTQISSKTEKKSSLHQLNSKLLEIKGFDYNLFLSRNMIYAKEFKLNAPKLVSKSNSDETTHSKDFQYFFSAENLQQLPYLEFEKFIVRDFTWLATYTVKGITTITTVEKANFEADDFRLSHRSFTNPERLFFSKSIEFDIQNLQQHFLNGSYLLMVNDIHFSSLQKQIDFNNIQFYTFNNEKQNNYNFNIARISLNEINFADFQNNFRLSINNIYIQNPVSELRFFGFDENSLANNLNTLELYPIFQPYFSQIILNKIDVRDMTFRLEMPKANSINSYDMGHINLQMINVRIDSTTQAFQNKRFFYSENTLVHLRNYSARIDNDLYTLNFQNLRLSTRKGLLEIDSLSLKPQYNYEDFAKHSAYQTDRFDIDIQSIKCIDFHFQDALFRKKYTIQQAEINALRGEIYRDGTYPRKPDYYPLNPIQRLLNLPYFLEIDSLFLTNSYFAYKEKGENTAIPGHIFFDQLNAKILNASNNPDFIKYGGNTILNANAMLMGKSKLNLYASFPLLDHGTSFRLNATLNKIEIDDLEPILRPLALIQAQSGTIKSMDMDVVANDDYAYGSMTMIYENLKVELLNKSMKKGFFSSLIANALIKTENTNTLWPRKGPIYFERKKNRSLFNYWAEISILGMKTSMGLADRRISKKVKKVKKLEENKL